jgi:hypothetical protein
MSEKRSTADILRRAQETLETAEWGLADFTGADPRRRIPGLRNLVVFGRAVTNVLQALRSVVGRDAFDTWYAPVQTEMREDQLLRFFYELRSEILKEGSTGSTYGAFHIETLNTDDLQPVLQNPPPGAKSFFMGDQLGGNGWIVELPDGTTAKYYIQLPPEIAENVSMTHHFANPPSSHKDRPLSDTSINALATLYVEYLRHLVADAREHFGVSQAAE